MMGNSFRLPVLVGVAFVFFSGCHKKNKVSPTEQGPLFSIGKYVLAVNIPSEGKDDTGTCEYYVDLEARRPLPMKDLDVNIRTCGKNRCTGWIYTPVPPMDKGQVYTAAVPFGEPCPSPPPEFRLKLNKKMTDLPGPAHYVHARLIDWSGHSVCWHKNDPVLKNCTCRIAIRARMDYSASGFMRVVARDKDKRPLNTASSKLMYAPKDRDFYFAVTLFPYIKCSTIKDVELQPYEFNRSFADPSVRNGPFPWELVRTGSPVERKKTKDGRCVFRVKAVPVKGPVNNVELGLVLLESNNRPADVLISDSDKLTGPKWVNFGPSDGRFCSNKYTTKVQYYQADLAPTGPRTSVK